MPNQIGDILNKSRFAEPEEIRIIRDYVRAHFNATPKITMQERQIIIAVPSAALAGALRTQLHELQELCGPARRLVIRISH